MKRSRSIFEFVIPLFIIFITCTHVCVGMVAVNDTVTTTANDGPGSLRQVIASASSGDTIVFDMSLDGDTIKLSTSITIDKSLAIIGNGIGQTTVDGSQYDDDRLFSVEFGNAVIFQGITFQHGGGANFNSNGGAISLIESDGAFISCFFHHNETAGFGDAGAVDAEGPADLDIVHCIFSNNIAGDDGGAIRTRFGIVLDIAQSTFVKNEAPDLGGGIYVVSANDDLTIHNSIIAGNTSMTGPDVFVIDPFTDRDYQYNLISDTNNIGDFPGLSIGYPTFVDEVNYNFQLADESVGIDAGDQNLIPVDQYDIDRDGDVAEVIDIDLDGGLRLVDCNVDLGPYENQEILTTRFIHNTNDMGPGSIRQVVSCALTGDTVRFSSSINGDSIQLKTGQISLDNISLTFIGNGSDSSIIDGSKQSTRFFLVQANAHIKFRDMTMQHAGDSTADIGGALVLYGLDSRIDLVNCRLANNLSGNRGGFIYVFLGHLNAINCVFDGNAVPGIDQDGGVIGIQNNSSLSVSQCLFKNNYASDAGSCIFSISSDMTITNCTFASNKTSDEAVIFFQSASLVTASNNIVYGNNGDLAFQQISGGTFDANNNLVDVPGSLVVGSNGNFISDPLFVDSLNGNYQLQNTSPAIDVGDVSLLPLDSCDVDGDGDLSEMIDVDLLGNQRVAICDLDLGAYENQFVPFCPAINDKCENAILIPVSDIDSCTYTHASTYEATTSIHSSMCFGGSEKYDLWYEFVAPASGAILLDYDRGPPGGPPVSPPAIFWSIWDECDTASATQINCEFIGGTLVGLTPDSTYLLQLWSPINSAKPRDSVDFCLQAFCPTPQFSDIEFLSPTSAIAYVTQRDTSIIYDVFSVRLCPADSSSSSASCLEFTSTPGADSVFMPGLPICTAYDIYVYNTCSTDFNSPIFLATNMASGSNTLNNNPICGDTVSYPGCGDDVNYSNFAKDTFYVCPNLGDTASIRFTKFNLEANFDFVNIYQNDTLIASSDGVNFLGDVFTASGPDTCLMVTFSSDFSVVNTGFDFVVENCTNCPNYRSITGLATSSIYHADTIVSNAVLDEPRQIIYQAQQEILLNNNFEVNLGATFDAVIGPCP